MISEDRDCKNCTHYVIKDSRTNWNGEPTTYIYGCEKWECEFERKQKKERRTAGESK